MNTGADKKAFSAALAVVAEVFNEQLSPVKIKAYFEDLQEFHIDEVIVGLLECRKACRFFPRPVEIREAIADERIRFAEQREKLREAQRMRALPASTELDRQIALEKISEIVSMLADQDRHKRRSGPLRSLAKLHDDVEALRQVSDLEHERKKRDAVTRFRREVGE